MTARARQVTWEAEPGRLTRHVRGPASRSSTHSCDLDLFGRVAWFLQQHPGTGVTAESLRRALGGGPLTQLNVALGFLTDRGLVYRAGKCSRATSTTVYEDALEAYHFLTEAGG